MKKQLILAAMCCLPFSLMAQKGFTIRGKIGTQSAPAKAYLNYTADGIKVTDSAVLKKGNFTFKGKLASPVQADLIIKHDTITRDRYAYVDNLQFYIDNADITVTSPDSAWRAVVKGSATNDDEQILREMVRPYKKSADSLVRAYNAWIRQANKDSSFLKVAGVIMRGTQALYDSTNRVFMASHPNSYISLNAFKEIELAYNYNPDTAEARFHRLSENVRNTTLGKHLAEYIEIGKRTNLGQVAMDFEQNDTTGKAVKLSDFRGQYVLLDFWASWCKPCRAENPNLLAAYNKYKEKNFTILGVSLDDNNGRRAWLHAVNQDGMPWTQVSELKGFDSKAAVLYGITAIPSNFLIDPQGKIVGKNLRGGELQAALAKLLH
ncbi:TlpA disulfide reductase family protein [Chitinophaga sp.]|uniref:TlpA disulfide reductase family protein n=1 Tax=Chitinophaga sp. TaxID=1869181 RepID=UPI002D0D5B38|nr:TlpA disulfide reductase family protein [Chitinophaga sp.]HWV65267.1 TlpA disulfide reductase family protein [Chitinophaga sp.]